jgi:hypothetical protein
MQAEGVVQRVDEVGRELADDGADPLDGDRPHLLGRYSPRQPTGRWGAGRTTWGGEP